MSSLAMYVIYEHPKDYPDKYVVRQWMVQDGKPVASKDVHSLTDTLEQARASLAELSLARLERFDDDDPVIKEVWL